MSDAPITREKRNKFIEYTRLIQQNPRLIPSGVEMLNMASSYEAALKEAEAEVERLRGALKPFAAMAQQIADTIPDSDRVPVDFVQHYGDEKDSVAVGDFRQARAALNAGGHDEATKADKEEQQE